LDVLRLKPLGPLFDFEFHFDTVIQTSVTVHGNGAKVNEDILACGPLDKSIALCVIEPLYNSTFSLHYFFS
jgi:hypothetical protein